jgi:aspartate-semialdehyde dehydrogenase
MTNNIDIAIVGVSGAVGEALVNLLEQRDFPVGHFFPLASARSAGNKVQLKGKFATTQDVADFDFTQVQLAIFCVPDAVAAEYVPRAAEAGCLVIDHSATFRGDPDVPLVVAEVNPAALADCRPGDIIASPAAISIEMLLALKPIVDAVGIERINVTTFEAVSNSGKAAVEELASQTVALLNMQDIKRERFAKQIAFNVLGQIDALEANGYSREEMNLVRESQKILGDDAIVINPTAVQVPVFFGHSMALHVETRGKLGVEEARELLARALGVKLVEGDDYPDPVSEAAGNDAVYVGRIREDISHPCGLNLWVVADNVRRGAALNSVQIAEFLVKNVL